MLSELYDIPTEDLVRELHRRYDVFFMAGMLADPGPEDDALHYWASRPLSDVAALTNYALSHHALQSVRGTIVGRDKE
jgi:hypothetical protein